MRKQINRFRRNLDQKQTNQQVLLTKPNNNFVEPSTPTNIKKPSKSKVGELRADDPLL